MELKKLVPKAVTRAIEQGANAHEVTIDWIGAIQSDTEIAQRAARLLE